MTPLTHNASALRRITRTLNHGPAPRVRRSQKLLLLSLALCVMAACLLALSTGRVYTGLNAGIAWDWGGVEVVGAPGLFLCRTAYDPMTGLSQPQAPAQLWPWLAVDC